MTQQEYMKCGRKVRHPDLLAGILHIRGLIRCNKDVPGLVVFPCSVCDGLHVGRVWTGKFKDELAEGKFEFVSWR